MSKDYTSHNERVEFFTKFIAKIILYNDRLIIIYNTRPNDSEEIIINGKEDIEKIETAIAKNAEKKSFSVNHAERLNDGGKLGIRTPGRFHVNGFQDRRFRPLSQLSILNFVSLAVYSLFVNVFLFCFFIFLCYLIFLLKI